MGDSLPVCRACWLTSTPAGRSVRAAYSARLRVALTGRLTDRGTMARQAAIKSRAAALLYIVLVLDRP